MDNDAATNEEAIPQGEFHHFQLVNPEGDVPILSISVLVRYNRQSSSGNLPAEPISSNEVIEFHEALKGFDGDYLKAFQGKSKN